MIIKLIGILIGIALLLVGLKCAIFGANDDIAIDGQEFTGFIIFGIIIIIVSIIF